MSARLDIDDREVVAAFERIRTGILHPQMLASAIGRKWRTLTLLGFNAATDPSGGKWLPLQSRKGEPLRDTGRLRNSILARAFGADLELGTNVVYAPTHQFGATIVPKPSNTAGLLFFTIAGKKVAAKQVTVPARPFLPVTRDDRVDLPETWLTGARDVTRIFFQNAAEGKAPA